jgi:PAS domain S-box-containing protein
LPRPGSRHRPLIPGGRPIPETEFAGRSGIKQAPQAAACSGKTEQDVGRAKDEDGDGGHVRHKELLAAIVESSHDAIVSKDLNGTITTWNRGAQLVFGYSAEEMIGQSVLKLIPEDRHGEEVMILDRIRRGERVDHYETVRRRKDGELIHVSLVISPIRGEGGRIVGASKIARDVTDRYRAEQTQRLLMRELNHRSKNLLAIVEAMVRKTASSTPPAELVGRVSQRLQALSAIQNLLVYGDWRGVDLRTLVTAQVSPYADGRLTLNGPQILLVPAAAQALGLAFHELATNALRHGSLTATGGSVSIDWSFIEREGKKLFEMTWREASGPAIAAPAGTSFGTTILKRATEEALNGTVSLDYDSAGLSWTITAPAREVTA